MEYVSNTTLAAIGARISAARRPMFITHRKPDGDAMGSVLALSRAYTTAGAKPEILLLSHVMANLRTLAGSTPFTELGTASVPASDPDLVVVVDTGAWSQLEPLEPWLREREDRVIVIDHHARGDDVGTERYVDTAAASATLIVTEMLLELGHEITGGPGGIAEALFAGLATDTGWFRFPNADARAFQVASRLLAAGVDKPRLYQMLEETYRRTRVAIAARALTSAAYVGDPCMAVMTLRETDFAETGADQEDLVGLVNFPMEIGEVRGSILLVEVDATHTKMSFRSKAGANGDPNVIDVNSLAAEFGGGGHKHAAGARQKRPLLEVRTELLERLASPTS